MNQLLTSLLIFGALATASPAQAATPPGSGDAVKTRVFKSRKAIVNTLGKEIADQLPPGFDFQLFALVWVDLPVVESPALKVSTVPAEAPLYLSHSPARALQATRTTRRLSIQISLDRPCSGGARRPPEVIQACRQGVQQQIAEAEKTLHLFATPRHLLEGARASRRHLPGRP